MQDNNAKLWAEAFEREVQSIQVEYDAFFIERKIQDFYTLRINEENGYVAIDIISRDDLPAGIIDRLTVAYLNSKPK